MGSAKAIRQVSEIVLSQDFSNPQGVVVSAVAGVTDKLIELCELAKDNKSYQENIKKILDLHKDIVLELELPVDILNLIETDLELIESVLKAIEVTKVSHSLTEVVSGYGEVWSAKILSSLLSKTKPVQFLDAREFLTVTRQLDGNEDVDLKISSLKLSKILASPFFVATGFVAAKENGAPTTLKRNGSDYSAALIANLLDAQSLTIWKDVDGVYCADPRKVPEAEQVRELTYDEILELAYFGAKVIHPKAISPLISKNILLKIKNTFRPNDPGTEIAKDKNSGQLIKGFSSIDDVNLINVEGKGLIGVPGIASKIFSTLKRENLSVTLISQGSSEYSICFAVRSADGKKAQSLLEQEFESDIKNQLINSIERIENCSILAVVGNQMAHRPGVAGKIFSCLGRARVNIKAIAQGSSERNVSVVIDSKDVTLALNALYSGVYREKEEVSLALIGPGLIGKAFLEQLKAVKSGLSRKVKVQAIASSKQMWTGKDLGELQSVKATDFSEMIQALKSTHKVIVDATASEEVAKQYSKWLEQGIHVITPNKKANCLPLSEYEKLNASAGNYLYETTVGAGLPIISTLKELKETGDEILKVEGVLSGTLSYIFNNLKGQKFSKILLEAKSKGLTEPDPRDDLSGQDVARKALILAREMGLKLELKDIEPENLVKHRDLQVAELADFLNQVEKLDPYFSELQQKSPSRVLRYVAEVSKDGARVGLKLVSEDDPLAQLKGADNLFVITTKRYLKNPLIIRGPGAGAEVTAAGILGDLTKLLKRLE